MTVTSWEVAKLAGVSQPTVSRALRDQRGVSPETRKRVRDAARELGYVPIQSGRALSTRTSSRIGIVSAELSNPFYPALIEPLHDGLADAGYRTILVTDRGEVPVEVEPLIDGSLDGVLLTTSTIDSSLPRELKRRGLPLVLVNRESDAVEFDRCVVDNAAGAAMVADLLVELGHTRIASIMGPDTTSTGQQRMEGFRQRLYERGVELPAERVFYGPFSAATGSDGLISLMAAEPTAVFCGNDVIAFGARNAALQNGTSVPHDLTVVGFDDIPMAAWPIFDLTTVATDLKEIANQAIKLLLWRMGNPAATARRVVIQPKMALRGTHSAPVTSARRTR